MGVSKCLRLITWGLLGVDCGIMVGCFQMIAGGLAVDYVINIFIFTLYNNTNSTIYFSAQGLCSRFARVK